MVISSCVTTLMVAALTAAPAPEGERAIDVLTHCDNVGAEPCMLAAAQLRLLGAAVLPKLVTRVDAMTPAGQVLVLSVVGDASEAVASELLAKLAKGQGNDESVRALAIDALAKRRDKRLATLAPTFMKDASTLVRQATVRALGNMVNAKDKKVLAILAAAARDPSPNVRAEAAFGLGFCNCKEAPPVLLKALADPVDEVRHAAAEGFCFVKHDPAVVALIPLLRSDNDLVARSAGRALRFQTDEDIGDDASAWEKWLAARK